jgi:hypothetical protein
MVQVEVGEMRKRVGVEGGFARGRDKKRPWKNFRLLWSQCCLMPVFPVQD